MNQLPDFTNLSWENFVSEHLQPLLQQARFDEGVHLLKTYHVQNPQNIDCLLSLGNLYKVSGHPNAYIHALHYYRLAQELNRELGLTFKAEAELQKSFGLDENALVAVKRALYHDNRDASLWKIYDSIANADTELLNQKFDLVFFTGHPDQNLLPYPEDLNATALGGSESVLLLMAKALANQGQKVAVFAPFAQAQVSEGIYCYPVNDFFVYQKKVELPTTIVSRYYQPFLNEFKASKRIFWLHDPVFEDSKNHYQQMDPQVDEYWALTNYQKNLYVQNCDLDENKFWLTTNPIDKNLFNDLTPLNARIKNRLIFCSRPDRGLDIVLDLFSDLKKELSDLSLTIGTYSTYTNPLNDPVIAPYKSAIEQESIKIEYMGKQKLADQLKQAHVMVYPNTGPYGETCCLAAVEAQGAGTPIVTVDNGGVCETVNHQKTGFVLDWNDNKQKLKEALLTKTRELLKNEALWQQISDKAYNSVWQKHDATVLAKNWLKHLQ